MTTEILDAYKQVKGKKTKILDEKLKPGKSLYNMTEYTAMLDKENVLTIKNARPFILETHDENDDEENDSSEDRAEKKEFDKVQSLKRRLSGRPNGVRQEDVISTQDLANRPQPLASKPKKRKKVIENPEEPDSYNPEDLPRLKQLLREPQSEEQADKLISAIVQLKLRELLSDMDGDEMDEGYLDVQPLPLMESVGYKTEWVKKLVEVRV